MYHLEERSVSTAVQYEKCAQIFVSSVNKTLSDIQFVTLRTAIRYNVNNMRKKHMNTEEEDILAYKFN